MKTMLLLIAAILCGGTIEAQQASDLLILKKNQKTVRTFFPGSEMMFNTSTRYYDAVVRYIDRDTIFLVQYDIKQVPTTLGVYMLDTLGTFPFSVNYKDIISFGKDRNKNFDLGGSGGVLLGGGSLIALVGLGTWIFTKPNTQYHASPYLVGGAALLAGVGYLMAKASVRKMVLGKKYTLQYIPVK